MMFYTLRLRQNGRRLADDVFKCIFLNENVWISLKISLKYVPKVPVKNIPALVQILAWRRLGDKPLSEPMMVSLLMHVCLTRPQSGNDISVQHFDLLDVSTLMSEKNHNFTRHLSEENDLYIASSNTSVRQKMFMSDNLHIPPDKMSSQ